MAASLLLAKAVDDSGGKAVRMCPNRSTYLKEAEGREGVLVRDIGHQLQDAVVPASHLLQGV